MPSKIPTTQERFAGVIEANVSAPAYAGVQGVDAAATACNDIHQANLLELLEDVELLIPQDKQEAFTLLKQQYSQQQ